MKKVFTTNEVPHIWAYQQQDEARNQGGNLYFNGLTIYSYGGHFPIARIYPDQKAVLFTTHTYSHTTAKHISLVWRAIPDHLYEVYNVPEVVIWDITSTKHVDNVRNYITRIIDLIKRNNKARKYNYIAEINSLIEEARKYAILFNVQNLTEEESTILNILDITNSSLIADVKQRQAAQSKLDKQHKIELKEAAKQNISDWQNNLTDEFRSWSLQTAYLRINGDYIETSKGAKVTIKEARLLWTLIKAGRDIKGHQVGHYTVISNNGVLKIGCHVIEREEVQRIGTLLDEMEAVNV